MRSGAVALGLVAVLAACSRDDLLHTAYDLSHSLPIAQQRTQRLALDLGTQSARAWLDDGWSWNEGEGQGAFVWSHGPRSSLRLSIHDPKDAKLFLKGFPLPAEQAQVVSVSLNGQPPLASFEMQGETTTYSVDVPEAALTPGVNSVELSYAYTRSTLGQRVEPRRDLGVGWHWIHLATGETATAPGPSAQTEEPGAVALAQSDLLRDRLTILANSELDYPLDLRPGSLFTARRIEIDEQHSLLLAVRSRSHETTRVVGRIDGPQRDVAIDLGIEDFDSVQLSLLTTGSPARIDGPLIRHPVTVRNS